MLTLCVYVFLPPCGLSAAERCMCTMQTGTQMTKLTGNMQLVRFFYLDEHKSCIHWRPSRKHDERSDIFQRYADSRFDPNCCFSIYHGDHITGLNYPMAGISAEDSLAKRQRKRDQYPLLCYCGTFSEADKNGDGNLSLGEVLQLIHKLKVNLPRQKVREMFKEADSDDNQGLLAFEEFCTLMMMMSTDYCLEIMGQFEPCAQNLQNMVLGIDGNDLTWFHQLAGDIFNPDHHRVHQDMTQPLRNYFIASSHNSYLTGDQLLSESKVDMYAYVLQASCHCVEVDCWDWSDGESIIHHGYTLTSKILLKDVIETINKYAFTKNQYPVILSIENHCTVPQQKKMAEYLMEVLQDKVDLSTVNMNEFRKLPSPGLLKGKVLVKGKKLPANIDNDAEVGDVSDEDSGEEEDEDEDDTQMNTDVLLLLFSQLIWCASTRQLICVYPSNYRVDSSNFNPQQTSKRTAVFNYQTEGRMLELNRAKFSTNDNCGYSLKPRCMNRGFFNPTLEDPLPGQKKTQLVLKIISGQQLPKPKDSMLVDRGEIIGLPIDCCKQQTTLIVSFFPCAIAGCNPMWEETLVFTLHVTDLNGAFPGV
uniref:Phosphoinositide phospholipase C n=1 Tax=Hucho hucho TaxID=62062 RepID=A0A4W5LFM9_9TELE